MTTALVRKSWTDLRRRPLRAVLTILTLALAVASFGILALPSLMNGAMSSEVAHARLYDIYAPIDETPLSPTQIGLLARVPNVTAVTARTMFATRTLIDGRRVDTEIWGVANFAEQPVDQVTTSHEPGPNQVLVDVRDGMSGISRAKAGDTLSIETAGGSFRRLPVAGTARAMAFNQDALTGHLVLYGTQATVESLSGFRGVNLLEFRLHDTRPPAAQATLSAVRSFLAAQPRPTPFSNMPTIRAAGDWPLKSIFNSRAKVLDILIILAVLSALFLLTNTIRAMVAEQAREIGVMRAVGASRRDVRNSYLRTAALVGGLGSLLGALLGMGLAYVLEKLFARAVFGVAPGFSVDWAVVAVGVGAGLAGTLLTAWPTLQRVIRTPVRDALAGEGAASPFGGDYLDRAFMRTSKLPPAMRLGVRNVACQKRRSASTIVQIALAVATLLGLMSLALAVTQVTKQSWNVLNYDITLSAQPGGALYDSSIVAAVAAQPGVAGVEAADWYQVTHNGQTLYALGVHARTFVHEPLTAGRWLNGQDERTGAEVAVIGSAAARRWHLRPGSRILISTAAGPTTYTVVGIGGSQADNGYNLYTTLSGLQAATKSQGSTNSLLVRASNKSHTAIDSLAARLETLMAQARHPSRSQIMFAGRATDQASAHSMLVIVEGIGLLVVAISMLGLVNAITMSILERTREIGILRCLGARARDLRRMFRTETITLALIGFVLAIPLGWLVAHALQWLVLDVAGAQLPAPYNLSSIGVAFVGTMLLAMLVVIVPLGRATRLRPGEALRYT